jgi:hypothetical protein
MDDVDYIELLAFVLSISGQAGYPLKLFKMFVEGKGLFQLKRSH